MFTKRELEIPGCFEIQPKVIGDDRGRFIKTFHASTFTDLDLETRFEEEFYSVSKPGVLRGMHVQLPPMDHVKLVYCAVGSVLDVVVDLRRGSPQFGKHARVPLSAEKGNMLYIPRGLAHGFACVDNEAVMMYKVSTGHSPAHDSGIRWDSAGIDWPRADWILSVRDKGLPELSAFDSPFLYDNAG